MAVTFTKAEIISDLKEVYKGVLQSIIQDVWKGDEGKGEVISMIESLTNIENESDDYIACQWAEQVSDKFFIEHPEADEVLMLTKTLSDNTKLKEWLASR